MLNISISLGFDARSFLTFDAAPASTSVLVLNFIFWISTNPGIRTRAISRLHRVSFDEQYRRSMELAKYFFGLRIYLTLDIRSKEIT